MSLSVVPLQKYCEISGEHRKAVERRIERGIWQVGKQALKIERIKERWIDLNEVEKWAREASSRAG
jgi:hypothetical protein